MEMGRDCLGSWPCQWYPKVRAHCRDGQESMSWILALMLSLVFEDRCVLDLGLDVLEGVQRQVGIHVPRHCCSR